MNIFKKITLFLCMILGFVPVKGYSTKKIVAGAIVTTAVVVGVAFFSYRKYKENKRVKGILAMLDAKYGKSPEPIYIGGSRKEKAFFFSVGLFLGFAGFKLKGKLGERKKRFKLFTPQIFEAQKNKEMQKIEHVKSDIEYAVVPKKDAGSDFSDDDVVEKEFKGWAGKMGPSLNCLNNGIEVKETAFQKKKKKLFEKITAPKPTFPPHSIKESDIAKSVSLGSSGSNRKHASV